MMFAALILEREPLRWAELPVAVKTWAQSAGAVAAVGLAIWCLAYLIHRPPYAGKQWSSLARVFVTLCVLAGVSYILLGLWGLARLAGIPLGGSAAAAGALPGVAPAADAAGSAQPFLAGVPDFLLALAGVCAILAATLPVLIDLATRFRPGRIWALARLSLKEAFRSRVVWVFSVMAVIFLFADWFVPHKPEDQLRNYVRVIYWSLAPLFLLTASLLGAFSIPTDVKNQSIHTIVTKPVERFEIVLGRFLGYAILLTCGLAILTGISLLYVLRGVRPEAATESFKARVPLFGDRLSFYGTSRPQGESVGRPWDYRTYIGGASPSAPQAPKQLAIWSYNNLPASDPDRPVYFEFTFDIFRLTKGKEDRDVIANFTFVDGRLSIEKIQGLLEKVQRQRTKQQVEAEKIADQKRQQGLSETDVQEWRNLELQRIEGELIDTYAIYEVSDKVIDYHTQSLGGEENKKVGLQVARLFQKLSELDRDDPRRASDTSPAPPALNVLINIDRQSAAQMLGVAKRDLYILAAQGSFWMNFIKGIVGMWFTILLILGLAVAASTYLSGVISWLCTLFLFGAGTFSDYIRQLAEGKLGAGPFEAGVRLTSGSPSARPLEPSSSVNLIRGADEVFLFALRGFLNIIPDVSRFDLHHYVANGFDISWTQVLFLDNFVPLVGYLLPWAVLAYYLMKFREVANPT